MASSSLSLTIIDQSFISPPKFSVPETSIPLFFLDVFFLSGGVVERLFFYKFPHPTSHFISGHLPTFKSSLSLTLQHFFPFAGHVRQSPSSPDVYELYYTDGDSVSLTISESTGDFQDLSGDHARDFSKLRPLIPTLAHESEPLMALQVTLFPNQGLCFGIVVSKVVADGTNSTNFIRSWAATCISGAGEVSFSNPPSLDRSNIGDPYNLYSIYLQTALHIKEMYKNHSGAGAGKKDEFLATFRLKKEHLEKIRAAIMAGYPDGKAPFHFSTFVISCAFMWTCLVRSKEWPEEKMAYFGFPLDVRPRLSPPLPAGFFGSCLAFKSTKAKVGDIVDEVTGVGAAAAAIGKAIDELKDGIFKDSEEMPQMLGEVVANQGLWIAGSTRFRVYEVDFGWGNPVKVEVTTIKGAETIAMAEDAEGGGGLEFGVSFPKDQFDAFAVCFNDALEALKA